MRPEVFRLFGQILDGESVAGPVLEIGAVPGSGSLLNLPALAGIAGKTGLNLEPFPSTGSIRMVTGNANRMEMFADGTFGCVLSNATLEHDARFWETLAEIRRVTAPGGLVAIGVPGFRGMGPRSLSASRLAGVGLELLARVTRSEALQAGTVTLGEHHFPGDYYRFTEQAVREVFLQGLVEPQCRSVMTPPRIVGWARKPCPPRPVVVP